MRRQFARSHVPVESTGQFALLRYYVSQSRASQMFVRRRSSWFRVICGVGMAAGILSGREFHDFDARAVGIVDIEAPLAVASNFRSVQFFQAVLVQLACGGLNFVHAQREMILHTALLGVCLGRNVKHVRDPVGAVRDLNFPPVVAGVLETTMPVHAETEQVP